VSAAAAAADRDNWRGLQDAMVNSLRTRRSTVIQESKQALYSTMFHLWGGGGPDT